MATLQEDRNMSLNITGNATGGELPGTSGHSTIRAIKLFLYLVIFLVSSIGNCLVCFVIMKRRKMKTVTNYFILNLAIADLLLTLICIPFDIPVQEMDYIWPYGPFMCKILYPLQTMCLFASIFTLTAVSLSRYWAIIHPLRRQLTIRRAKCILVSIWVISLIPVSPYINALQHEEVTQYCDEKWTNRYDRKAYTVVLFVFQYIIPLTLITAAYARIGKELRSKKLQSENKYLQSAQAQEASKVIRMLTAVTALFAICVLPTNIMWLWLDFGQGDKYFKYFWNVVAFCNIMTFANSAANPVCYTMLNENYRREIMYSLRRLTFCNDRRMFEHLEMTENTRRDTVMTTTTNNNYSRV